MESGLPNHTSLSSQYRSALPEQCGIDYEGGVLRFPPFEQEIIPQAECWVGFMCDRNISMSGRLSSTANATRFRSGSRWTLNTQKYWD